MRVKKYLGLAIISALTICLTACGESFPEMTEEEYNQTVEFAVGLLMKYSNNGQAKLTYVDAKALKKQREKEAKKAQESENNTQNQNTSQTNTKDTSSQQTLPAPNPDNTKDVADNTDAFSDASKDTSASESTLDSTSVDESQNSTDKSDTSENQSQNDNTESSAQQDPGAIVLSSEEKQEILDDIFLSYEGYSVSSSFPESSKSYVINAEKGKKLLVLRFDLFNASESDKKVNLLERNITFQILLNGKNLGYTAVTVLPNDLSSYVGTIESKAHESLVVLTEIDSEISTQIKDLGMIVSISGNKQTVSLK